MVKKINDCVQDFVREELMLTARARRIVVIILGLLLCVFTCVGMTKLAGPSSQAPIRTLRVTIDESQRQELFDQLRSFAEKHGFEFLLADYGSGGELYLVQLLGNDIKFQATITRADPKIVSIGVFDKDPANPVPAGKVDELVRDLKEFLGNVPDVTITEKK